MEGLDMQDKIAWYEEILAQDPGSPLFFNLAQLHLEQGEREKAVGYLQDGLDRNPAHAQARLLLIQTLAQAQSRDEAMQYMKPLLDGLCSSPHFWDLWAEKLEEEGKKEVAAAARFIGADIGHGPLTWARVLSAGCRALAGNAPPDDLDRTTRAETAAPPEGPGDGLHMQTDPNILPGMAGDEHELLAAHGGSRPGQETGLAGDDLPAGGYRTLTMADIMAGQGEFETALDIYAQLLAAESDPERRQKITDRMDSVSRRMGHGESTGPDGGQAQEGPGEEDEDLWSLDPDMTGPEPSEEEPRYQTRKKEELLRRLDELASRLEAKG